MNYSNDVPPKGFGSAETESANRKTAPRSSSSFFGGTALAPEYSAHRKVLLGYALRYTVAVRPTPKFYDFILFPTPRYNYVRFGTALRLDLHSSPTFSTGRVDEQRETFAN